MIAQPSAISCNFVTDYDSQAGCHHVAMHGPDDCSYIATLQCLFRDGLSVKLNHILPSLSAHALMHTPNHGYSA